MRIPIAITVLAALATAIPSPHRGLDATVDDVETLEALRRERERQEKRYRLAKEREARFIGEMLRQREQQYELRKAKEQEARIHGWQHE
ncbi:hypothetical protein GQ602_005361 [Ophiocordyceps camponoti-floridani]|uniref:Uncharacterized protein n=1 Tax=Ophiocordyceps camponoti-floridani TaxID=2030778 RepID=A0A8H4Q5K3_9HYPO|nr:hypothetical protein GQ602_005361 [Ophiocordyceps camponoti-floridani]